MLLPNKKKSILIQLNRSRLTNKNKHLTDVRKKAAFCPIFIFESRPKPLTNLLIDSEVKLKPVLMNLMMDLIFFYELKVQLICGHFLSLSLRLTVNSLLTSLTRSAFSFILVRLKWKKEQRETKTAKCNSIQLKSISFSRMKNKNMVEIEKWR